MDQQEAIRKARQFTETAYNVELEKIVGETHERLEQARNRAAANGTVLSGNMVAEIARIRSEQMTVLLKARVNLLLEGFDLHHVMIDDGIRDGIVAELTALRTSCVDHAAEAMKHDSVLRNGPVNYVHFLPLLESAVGMRPNEVRTIVERVTLKPKGAGGGTINIYHVNGNNNRWLNNSQDYSVNVVTQSSEQIFAALREEIASKTPAGDEQKDILERLTALEEAQNSPFFEQNYTEFIAAAANHMQLICPFIPALTEMLHKEFS